jgi:hypothetical protein
VLALGCTRLVGPIGRSDNSSPADVGLQDAFLPINAQADGAQVDAVPETGILSPDQNDLGEDGAISPDSGPFSRTHRIYLAIEGSGGFIQPLELDLATLRVRPSGNAVSLTFGGALRSLTQLADGRLAAGSGARADLEVWSPGDTTTTLTTLDHGTAAAEQRAGDAHGLCGLTDGSLVIGEFSGSTGNAVSQYAWTGERASFLRGVHLTTLSRGCLGGCVQRGNTLWLTVLDANDDGDGDVVQMSLDTDDNWQLEARFDTSTYPGGTTTPIYAVAPHTDGNLYLFPMHRFGSRLSNLIRCNRNNINAAQCSDVGPLPSTGSTSLRGADALFAATQLAGTNDLIFTTNRALYRYRLAAAEFDELLVYADAGLPVGQPSALDQVRAMVVDPP